MTDFIDLQASRVVFGDGKFDSLNRYLRANSSASSFPLAKARTIDIRRVVVSGLAQPISTFRYAVGSALRETTFYGSGTTIPVDAGAYATPIVRVTT